MGIRIRSVAVLGLVALLGILWSMSPRTRGAPEAGPRTEVEATRANIEGALPLAGGETADRFRRRAEIESEVLGKLGATSPVRGEDASTPAELGARIAAAAGVRMVVDPALADRKVEFDGRKTCLEVLRDVCNPRSAMAFVIIDGTVFLVDDRPGEIHWAGR